MSTKSNFAFYPIMLILFKIYPGWGSTSSSSYDRVMKLRQVQVPSIPSSMCRRLLGNRFKPCCMLCHGLMAGGRDHCYVSRPFCMLCHGLMTGGRDHCYVSENKYTSNIMLLMFGKASKGPTINDRDGER